MASSYGFGTRSRPAPMFRSRSEIPYTGVTSRPAPMPRSRNRIPYTGVTPTSPWVKWGTAKRAAQADYKRREEEGLIEPSGDPITSAVVGTQGVINLFRQDLNPEGLTYPTRMVPTVRGGMLSGGPPNVGQSVAALVPAMLSSITARDRTSVEQQVWDETNGNPIEYKRRMAKLAKDKKAEQSIQASILEDKKSFDTMMSILRSHGMSEADVYRNVVVSPDGRVNVNPNTMAVLSSVGNVSDAMRLFDFVGWGAGKPVAAGARVAGAAASRVGRRTIDTLLPRAYGLATNPNLLRGLETATSVGTVAGPRAGILSGVASALTPSKATSSTVSRITVEDAAKMLDDPLSRMAPTKDRKTGRVIVDRLVSQTNSRSLKGYNLSRKREGLDPVDKLPEDKKVDSDYMLQLINDAYTHPGNMTYIEGMFGTGKASALEVSHPITGNIGKKGKPDSMVGGDANRLEEAARIAGAEINSWNDVMAWGIKNYPQYANETIESLAGKLGAAHLII